jgi:type II secretory pathway component GspD/PulD (secretin)
MNRLLLAILLCAACHTPTTPPPAKPPGAGGDLHVQVAKLENAQAKNVVKVVQESLAGRTTDGVSFKVVVHPDQNALVFSGTTAQIREAMEVVAQLDSGTGR